MAVGREQTMCALTEAGVMACPLCRPDTVPGLLE
ncbi:MULTISPECIES: DUF6233 domain-containing protein [Streptomyces]|nr:MULTISPECIES: DUF6233 domain-containing protein [Streptomyces]